MNNKIKISLGILLSVICLWVAFRNFQLADLHLAIKNAIWIWFLPMFCIHIIALLVRAYRWKVILSPLSKIPYIPLTQIMLLGYFLNNVLPARAGEFARSAVIKKEFNIPFSTTVGSIALERLMDLVGLVIIILLAIKAISNEFLPVKTIMASVLIGFTGIFLFILWAPQIKIMLAPKNKYLSKATDILENLSHGFSSIKRPSQALLVASLSVGIWLLDAFSIFLLSRSFDLSLSFHQSAALLTGISFGVMIPAAPGYVGTFEMFGKESLTLMGFPDGLSLSFVLVLHFFQMLIVAGLGIPQLIRWGFPKQKLQGNN